MLQHFHLHYCEAPFSVAYGRSAYTTIEDKKANDPGINFEFEMSVNMSITKDACAISYKFIVVFNDVYINLGRKVAMICQTGNLDFVNVYFLVIVWLSFSLNP